MIGTIDIDRFIRLHLSGAFETVRLRTFECVLSNRFLIDRPRRSLRCL